MVYKLLNYLVQFPGRHLSVHNPVFITSYVNNPQPIQGIILPKARPEVVKAIMGVITRNEVTK
jgi:hypothetical protein